MWRKGISLWGGIVALGLIWAGPALAQRKSVAEEILDILRANNQISAQQYRDLLIRAQAEEEQRAAEQEQIEAKLAAQPPPDLSGMKVYWKEGLRLDSSDGDFKLKIGGRIQNDWAIYGTDDDIREEFGPIGDGTRFRRARIFLEGEIYENIKYKAEYDFASSGAFTDVYVELKNLPVLGSYQVGHFKEPFSLEEQTSSRFITFMERALPNLFSPARNTGMMLSNAVMEERATWALGVFRETGDLGDGFGIDSLYNVTARVTALPWYQDKGRQLAHLGFGYSHKFMDDDTVRLRQRPESGLGPRFVDTGDFIADGMDIIGPEVALVYGPFSLQGEYMMNFVDASETGDPEFTGYYVYGSYFLTGEHRVYKPGSGAFDRVKPFRNFGSGGWGAWELGARYSYLDLEDSSINGGELGDFTFGINWYLNPNVRFQFNYVFADVDDVGEANIVQARFQVDF